MKVIIQIPCLNEEETLPETLAELPRELEGVDSVEWQVINDGSTDRTVDVALENGVHHIVTMNGNQGLARAFMAGLAAAIDRGADIIVNTDADNQYNAADIPKLVAPILAGNADVVIGARPISAIQHFSPIKRALQKLGSFVVRTLSGTTIHDAPSGFRAISRDAALRLNVFSRYTYTLETIIQAGHSNLRIMDVPIRVNGPTRPSRLVKSIASYVRRSILDLVATYLVYSPTRVFNAAGVFFLVPAGILSVRYLHFVWIGEGAGHIQSVIVAGALAVCGVFMFAIGIVARLLGVNRRLLEEIRYLHRTSHGSGGGGKGRDGAGDG